MCVQIEQNQLQTAMAYYQQHMLSIKSRNTLAHILAEYTLINQTNQSYRQAIGNAPYFDSLALFRLIDRNEKGYICEKDLQNVIGTKHRKLLTYAFTWIDSLKSGEVSRLEFATFLLPRDNLQLRQLIAQRLQHPQIEHCSKQAVFEQFSIFRQMILEIIKRQMKIIQLRRQLISQPDYSVHGSLLAIDNNRHDWVCAEDIEKFMKNYGYEISLRQVEKLVEVMNSSLDGKVSQQQLKWVIEGLQGSDRSYLERIKQANRSLPPQKPVNVEQKFKQYRSKSKTKPKSTNREEQKYSQLVSQLKQVQQQQRKADQNLLLKERVSIDTMNSLLQEQRMQLQVRKKILQQQKEKERLIIQAKYKMEQEMQYLLQKTQHIEAESQRLARIDNRTSIHNDLLSIRRTIAEPSLTSYYQQRENRPPSFGRLQETYTFYPKKKYQQENISIQNADYVVDRSSLNNSNRLSESIKKHIESSDLYLETTRRIKEKIKAEREAERHIREKFNDQELIRKYKEYKPVQILTNKQPGTIQQSKIELGLQSRQKDKNQHQKWQSPQQRAVRQSVLQKLDQSTTNKVETAR